MLIDAIYCQDCLTRGGFVSIIISASDTCFNKLNRMEI